MNTSISLGVFTLTLCFLLIFGLISMTVSFKDEADFQQQLLLLESANVAQSPPCQLLADQGRGLL